MAQSQRFNSDKTLCVFTECDVSTHTRWRIHPGSSQDLGVLLAESCAHTLCLNLTHTLILNIRGTTACLCGSKQSFPSLPSDLCEIRSSYWRWSLHLCSRSSPRGWGLRVCFKSDLSETSAGFLMGFRSNSEKESSTCNAQATFLTLVRLTHFLLYCPHLSSVLSPCLSPETFPRPFPSRLNVTPVQDLPWPLSHTNCGQFFFKTHLKTAHIL